MDLEGMYIKHVINIDEEIMRLLLVADPSKDAINNYINRCECYIALINNKIAGVYVVMWTRPYTMELVNIAVIEEMQGKGVGKKLVYDCIERARKQGAKELEVGTGNSSLNQLGFYQKCGFRISGIDKDFFIKHYTEEIYENGIKCIDMIRLRLGLEVKD